LNAGEPAAIRAARRSDAGAIAELWNLLVAEHAALDPAFALRPDAGIALEGEVARALDDADTALWVAEREARVVAFCCARIARAAPPVAERSRLEITELAVEPTARRRGDGRALVEVAFAWARERGASRVEVRVAARNDAGQAFWRRLGFNAFVDVLDRRL
jgi:ribosomal protein S18 acetylase RimI-like enzyme